jgi:hypothetical protein
MQERQPYEEQLKRQLSELPLPDENVAWADMSRRLDDEKRRRFIPPFTTGCLLWGFIGLLVLTIGWWILRPDNKSDKKKEIITKLGSSNKPSSEPDRPLDSVNGNISRRSPSTIDSPLSSNNSVGKVNGSTHDSETEILIKTQNASKKKRVTNQVTLLAKIQGPKVIITNQAKPVIKNQQQPDSIDKTDTKEIIPTSTIPDSPASQKLPPVKDSITKKYLDTIVQRKDIEPLKASEKNKKDSTKKKNVSFSVGLAMHQQLPLDSQNAVPYNSLGRKGTVADYIPSIYLRMYKENKWFLQSEFRYGAPQYTREFEYSRKSELDTIPGAIIITTTSTKLKKTYYHQLPLTFNYFILPGLSVGSGLVWNKFSSAVSDQEIRKRLPGTQIDSLVSKGIISNRSADSNFVKSYFQALVETQFKWKRLSLGARYAFGLEPYIRFSLPGGTLREEKNKSLQVFLRFELWRSSPGK